MVRQVAVASGLTSDTPRTPATLRRDEDNVQGERPHRLPDVNWSLSVRRRVMWPDDRCRLKAVAARWPATVTRACLLGLCDSPTTG